MNLFRPFLPPLLVLCLHCALIMSEPIVDTDEVKSTNGASCDTSERAVITPKDIEDVFKSCQAAVKARLDLEQKLRGRVVSGRKADSSLNRMKKSDPIVRQGELNQMIFDEVTNQLYPRYNMTPAQISRVLPRMLLKGGLGSSMRDTCLRNIASNVRCDRTAKYRTADGSCNNLKNPDWGRAMTCQRRLMAPHYVGSSGYRMSVKGGDLPEPRILSLRVHNNLNKFNTFWNHLFVFFGQFLDHDIALTPTSTTMDNQPIECCPQQNETHPQCKPIILPPDDPFYSQFEVICLNFVRSAMCPTCNLGHKEVMSMPTAFIDLSALYGNSDEEMSSLRTNDGTGRLLTQDGVDGQLLPRSQDPQNDQCSIPERRDFCFRSGDSRVNQHTMLTSLHTIYLRFHNLLADELRKKNPHWNGEKIFQEARRLNIAIYQHTVYSEFLPILLGEEGVKSFDLEVGRKQTKYNSYCNPSLILEFSTAIYRLGHSLVHSIIANSPRNATGQSIELKDDFFRPFLLYKGYAGPLLRGASNSLGQEFDRHVVPDLTNFLYRVLGDSTGLDLAAININRGRDHGLPPYVEAVKFVSGGKIIIKDFKDLGSEGYGVMEDDQMKVLQDNYKDVRDVDMWTGVLSEKKLPTAVGSNTTIGIMGIQFKAWLYGDRYFYEHDNTDVKFRSPQLKEIRKTNFSQVICLTTGVPNIPSNAMLLVSDSNPVMDCSQVKKIDLSAWQEKPPRKSFFSKLFDVLPI